MLDNVQTILYHYPRDNNLRKDQEWHTSYNRIHVL